MRAQRSRGSFSEWAVTPLSPDLSQQPPVISQRGSSRFLQQGCEEGGDPAICPGSLTGQVLGHPMVSRVGHMDGPCRHQLVREKNRNITG